MIKSKPIDRVRSDVPQVQKEEVKTETRDKRVNILVTEEQRKRWRKHAIDFGNVSVTDLIIAAVEEKISRDTQK